MPVNDRSYYRAYITQRRSQNREWLNSLKADGCIKCGETETICLDYHHIDPSNKEFAISSALIHNISRERVLAEISKCVLLCANCHRKQHKYGQLV